MNPNSANQWWSKWVWFVKPGRQIYRTWNEVQANLARFGKKIFGSAAQMRIRETTQGYIVEVLAEGQPAHDKNYVEFMDKHWLRFFENGFGLGTTSVLRTKLMAGSKQDGTPSEQMLIMPFISLLDPIKLEGKQQST